MPRNEVLYDLACAARDAAREEEDFEAEDLRREFPRHRDVNCRVCGGCTRHLSGCPEDESDE